MDGQKIIKVDVNIDKDLVELAGYHAYLRYKETNTINVNISQYRVVNTMYDHETGLDALTVKSSDDKYIIIYVGTDTKSIQDIMTDAQLLGDVLPAQLQEARDYFDDMSKLYPISYICGNSLGGALANVVAVDHPEVKTVTLNPALLPEGVVDPDKEYSNITNYFSQYDILTKTITGLKYDHRIPGKIHKIYNGVPSIDAIDENHTGYVRNEEGTQYYKVGTAGDPGYGKILMEADAHIVTSIWSGKPLYGGSSERIEINEEMMANLVNNFDANVLERLSLADTYIANATMIVHDENNKFAERVMILQDIFREMIERTSGYSLLRGITMSGYVLKAVLDEIIDLLNLAESKVRFLNKYLNSPPAEIIEFITRTNLSVESLFDAARSYVHRMKDQIDEFTDGLHYIDRELIPALFAGGAHAFIDAVVQEVNAHYEIVNRNREKIKSQLMEYKKQVIDTAAAFKNRDEQLARAIATKSGMINDTGSVQNTNMYHMEESPYMKVRMKLKEIHLEMEYMNFQSVSSSIVFPIVEVLKGLILTIESTLEMISITIKSVTDLALYGNPPGFIISLFSNFDDNIRRNVKNLLKPLKNAEEILEMLRKELDNFIVNFPNILQNLRPYIDSALFNNEKYKNIHLYSSATLSIIKETETLFKDIVNQLSHQKGKAIEELCDVSKYFLANIKILEEQIDRVTLN
ncbi:hypothetical protein J9303_15710 [Bacillaceae bacterium Marseille-Q3522]|nr:hypothetical protein [Bacillaceae bacterium Marseille-Q3522]